jgi:hypothetical protein
LQQQPGGQLHQAGGQPHAFGGIGDGAVAVEGAGILAAGAIEIVGGFLDQAHAFLEHLLELIGGGEALDEVDGDGAADDGRHGKEPLTRKPKLARTPQADHDL